MIQNKLLAPELPDIPEYDYKNRLNNLINLEKIKDNTTSNNIGVKTATPNASNHVYANIKNKINEVSNYIANNHDVTPFIYFKVNNFELDTSAAGNDYMGNSNLRKHYAISLENQKTGVGAGNQFTLTIAYHSDFSDFNSAVDLEKALAYLEDNENRNECILKYGYISDTIAPTEEYHGRLLEYNVNANKQIITYTLKGYTSEKTKIGTVNWYPEIKSIKEEVDTQSGSKILVADEFLTKDDIKKEYDTEAKIEELITDLEKGYGGGPIYMNPIQALVNFIYDYNHSLIDSDATTFEIDCTRVGGGIGDTEAEVISIGHQGASKKIKSLRPVVISLCRNQTPLDYVKYLISLCVEDTGKNYALLYTKEQQNILDRWVYYIRNNKEENKIRIVIDLISSNKYNNDTEYIFEGYTIDNSLLIDYSLNYDGTVALAVDDMTDEKEENHIYIDSSGALRKTVSITRDMFVEGAISDVLVKNENTWLDKICVANNCSMKTFGLPFEIPVSSVFRVEFNLTDKDGNSTLHHTSGRCFVVGITDRIENNMFTTDFKMIRLPNKYRQQEEQ